MKRLIPFFTLALLSPFIAEILFGATPLSRSASLPPLLLLYGGGAVLIRELARRTSRPWTTILFLGAAYCLIEEGIVMQTLFSPDLFGAAACGARFGGVNWVWTEELLGYHAVWSIAIPIALAELCFPKHRDQPWLGRTGVIVALFCYLLGALSIGLAFRRIVTPAFRAPLVLLISTALFAAAIVAWALKRKPAAAREEQPGSPAGIVSPWLAGAVALGAAILWMQFSRLPQTVRTGLWPLLPMALAAGLAWYVYRLVTSWVRHDWTDLHRVALIWGAVAASAAYGVDIIKQAAPVDRIGQAACSIAFFACLALLTRRLKARGRPTESLNPLK